MRNCDSQKQYPIISIHAPREGGDLFLCAGASSFFDFNPRPPRGGRRRVSRLFDKLR